MIDLDDFSTSSHAVSAPQAHRLRRLNLGAGILHLAQGVAMLALSNGLKLPVSATFATAQPGQALDASRLSALFSYRLGPAVAAFSLLSAAFHFLVASPWVVRYAIDGRHRSKSFRTRVEAER